MIKFETSDERNDASIEMAGTPQKIISEICMMLMQVGKTFATENPLTALVYLSTLHSVLEDEDFLKEIMNGLDDDDDNVIAVKGEDGETLEDVRKRSADKVKEHKLIKVLEMFNDADVKVDENWNVIGNEKGEE